MAGPEQAVPVRLPRLSEPGLSPEGCGDAQRGFKPGLDPSRSVLHGDRAGCRVESGLTGVGGWDVHSGRTGSSENLIRLSVGHQAFK